MRRSRCEWTAAADGSGRSADEGIRQLHNAEHQFRRTFAGEGGGDLAAELAQDLIQTFQHLGGVGLLIGKPCADGDHELGGVRRRINWQNLDALQQIVAALAAEHEAERFRHLGAKLPGLPLSLAGPFFASEFARIDSVVGTDLRNRTCCPFPPRRKKPCPCCPESGPLPCRAGSPPCDARAAAG